MRPPYYFRFSFIPPTFFCVATLFCCFFTGRFLLHSRKLMETMVLRVDHPTCHPRLIENTAVALADMIFHKKEPTRKLLLRLNASAVRRTSHTRTLSLVVQKLLRELHWRNTELYHDVKEEVLHMAVTTFIDYWKAMLSDALGPGPTGQRISTHDPLSIHIAPLAVSSYIGDLYAMELLSADMLKACITFLVNRVRTPFHLHCVEQLFDHANSSQIDSRLEPCFLLDCIKAIHRSHRYIKHVPPEEDSLIRLIYRLLFQPPHKTKHRNRWDRHLSSIELVITPYPDVDGNEMRPLLW